MGEAERATQNFDRAGKGGGFRQAAQDIFFAAGAAQQFVGTLRGVYDTAHAWAQVGESAERSKIALTGLVGGATQEWIDALKRGAEETLTSGEAAAQAYKLIRFGLVDSAAEAEKFIHTMSIISAINPDLGGTSEAISQIQLTLSNMSFMRLDQLGISAGVVRKRMAELKEETAGMTDEAAFQTAVMEQLEQQANQTGDAILQVGLAENQVNAKWGTFKEDLGLRISEGFTGWGVAILGVVAAIDELGARRGLLEIMAGLAGSVTGRESTPTPSGADFFTSGAYRYEPLPTGMKEWEYYTQMYNLSMTPSWEDMADPEMLGIYQALAAQGAPITWPVRNPVAVEALEGRITGPLPGARRDEAFWRQFMGQQTSTEYVPGFTTTTDWYDIYEDQGRLDQMISDYLMAHPETIPDIYAARVAPGGLPGRGGAMGGGLPTRGGPLPGKFTPGEYGAAMGLGLPQYDASTMSPFLQGADAAELIAQSMRDAAMSSREVEHSIEQVYDISDQFGSLSEMWGLDPASFDVSVFGEVQDAFRDVGLEGEKATEALDAYQLMTGITTASSEVFRNRLRDLTQQFADGAISAEEFAYQSSALGRTDFSWMDKLTQGRIDLGDLEGAQKIIETLSDPEVAENIKAIVDLGAGNMSAFGMPTTVETEEVSPIQQMGLEYDDLKAKFANAEGDFYNPIDSSLNLATGKFESWSKDAKVQIEDVSKFMRLNFDDLALVLRTSVEVGGGGTPAGGGGGSGGRSIPEFQHGGYTGGGSRPFMARLHPREFVVPEMAMRGGGGGGAERIELTSNVILDGKIVGRSVEEVNRRRDRP
jgi:hypothetical protein